MSPDFELIDCIFIKIAEKEQKLGTEALSEEQQVVGTVWHVSGIVENGGVSYFLEHTFPVEEVALAFEAIRIPELAAILRKAIAKFPNSRRPADFKKFTAFMNQHQEFFDDLGTQFLEIQEDKLEKMLVAYIKQHEDAFKEFM